MERPLETATPSDSGEVLLVGRGDKGAAVINLATSARSLDLSTALPAGEYYDTVYGQPFVVENGRLKGVLKPATTYILYSK